MFAFGCLRGRAVVAGACLLLAGCASDVFRVPAQFLPAAAGARPVLTVTRAVEVIPSTGYPSTVPGGSRWRYLGRVPQGRVYAIQGDVFTVAGRHTHEAYCVIAGASMLVGFYLPVEQAFAPLQAPVRLSVAYQ